MQIKKLIKTNLPKNLLNNYHYFARLKTCKLSHAGFYCIYVVVCQYVRQVLHLKGSDWTKHHSIMIFAMLCTWYSWKDPSCHTGLLLQKSYRQDKLISEVNRQEPEHGGFLIIFLKYVFSERVFYFIKIKHWWKSYLNIELSECRKLP